MMIMLAVIYYPILDTLILIKKKTSLFEDQLMCDNVVMRWKVWLLLLHNYNYILI